MKFIYTNVLLLMLIPSLILMYLIITKQTSLSKYFSVEILNKLSVSNQYFSNKARNITMFLALIFFIIALARPVTNEQVMQTSSEKTTPFVIALDVSKSMLANDIYPTRLTFAKNKLLEIIDYAKQNSIGVILFAKSSYILSPLTTDFNSLKILVENLDTGANFDNGTNILSVIETSNKLLKDYENKKLILLTDGGDEEDFEVEVNLALKNNIQIYTLGLATKTGSAVKLKDGNYLTNKNGDIVTLKLNEKIKDLSLNTKGGYINFSLNNSDFKQIIDDINSGFNSEIKLEKKRKTYTELFYYPLALGIFLFLMATSSLPTFKRRNLVQIFILVCLFSITSKNLYALEFDFQTIKKANEYYENKNYEQAIKEFKSLDSSSQRDYDLANSYYKNENYNEAIELYKNIKTEDRNLNHKRLHNLGNSYAKNNNLDEAIKSYEEALKVKIDDQIKENLDLVKNLKHQQKNKQENEDQQNSQNNQEEKNDEKKQNQQEQKDKQKNQSKEENKEDSQNGNVNQNVMSDYEEQKWLKQLENKKTNSLLKKMESSKEDSSSNPW